MARPSAWIMLFLICLHLASGLWVSSGVAADWGVEPSVGGDEQIDQIQDTSKNETDASAGGASFMVGLIVGMTEKVKGILDFVYAGPTMFKNLGAPGWIVDGFFGTMYLIVFLDIIYLFTGRDM